MSKFERRIEAAWSKHSTIVGELVEQHDKRFRKIVRRYSNSVTSDFDQLYSDYVVYRMPLYIEAYRADNEGGIDLLEWICDCIRRRVIKATSVARTKHDLQNNNYANKLNYDLICRFDAENGTLISGEGTVEEMLRDAGLSRYEGYLIKSILIEKYKFAAVSRVGNVDWRTVKKKYKLALKKLRLYYK